MITIKIQEKVNSDELKREIMQCTIILKGQQRADTFIVKYIHEL